MYAFHESYLRAVFLKPSDIDWSPGTDTELACVVPEIPRRSAFATMATKLSRNLSIPINEPGLTKSALKLRSNHICCMGVSFSTGFLMPPVRALQPLDRTGPRGKQQIRAGTGSGAVTELDLPRCNSARRDRGPGR